MRDGGLVLLDLRPVIGERLLESGGASGDGGGPVDDLLCERRQRRDRERGDERRDDGTVHGNFLSDVHTLLNRDGPAFVPRFPAAGILVSSSTLRRPAKPPIEFEGRRMSIGNRALLIAGAAALGVAAAGPAGAVELKEIARIPVTLDIPLNGFDIGAVDLARGLVYFTSSAHFFDPKVIHPGNNVLLVIDIKTNKLVKAIPGFEHPSGVTLVDDGAEAWVSDGNSTVKVVDLKTGKVVDTISTGGKDRADESAWDPKDQVYAVANGDDDPPFLTLISTKPGHKVLAKIEVAEATDGLEQTIYSSGDGMFYTDVPEMNKDKAKGGMMVTNPRTGKRVAILPVKDCRPHGNAVGLDSDLILGCNAGSTRTHDGLPAQQAVFNTKTHKVTYIPGAGGTDMSAADDRLGAYYTASVASSDPGPVLAVIDAKTLKIVQKIPTTGLAHSVAADPQTHHVFVPSAGGDFKGCGCIIVYAPE